MQDEPTSGGDAPTAEPTVSDAFQEAKEAFTAAGSVLSQNVKKVVKKARRAIVKATSRKKTAKAGKKKTAKKKAARKKAARKPARETSAARGRKVARKKTAARKKAGRAKK
jgi:hypothetical protein